MTSDISTLIVQHKYLALLALIIGFVVRLLKSDTVLPVTVSPKLRGWVAVLLGAIGGIVEHLANGTPWREALASGITAGVLSIVGHELLVESLRGGKEVPVPKALSTKDE